MTSISSPCARLATSEPTLPRPTTPSVLPRTSTPTNLARVHSPRLTDASAWGTQRARANSNAIVCSAAATMLPRGALTTRIPLRVAAVTSMLSTPTPARPTTRSFRPASMTEAVTRVSLRTTSASKSGMRRINSSSASLLTTVTSPALRRRSMPSSARGSATRIFATTNLPKDGRLARRGGYALHRGGDRGHAASVRRRDVELLQRLFDRPDHLHHVTLGDSAQVSDPDHLAGHLALAAGDDHSVPGVEQLAQRGNVEAAGRQRRRHCVRPVTVLREELKAERMQSCLRRASEPGMALVHVAEALLLEHVQAFLQREGDRDCRRERRHAFFRPGPGFLPVEVKAWRPRLGLLCPCALAHADQRQPRRRHPSLLRAADRDIDTPGVGLDVDRADRADAVDHDQSFCISSDTCQLSQRVGEPGRRFVVRQEHDPGVGMAREDDAKVVRVDGLPPLELQAHHGGALSRRRGRETLTKVPAQGCHHLVAG